MLIALVNYFYPDLNEEDSKKFTLLSLTFFLIIGAYWLARLLKNAIFYKVAFPEELGWLPGQGRLFQPVAKFWSPFIVFGMVMIYTKLIDMFKKHILFYIIGGVYSIIFGFITGALILRSIYGDAFLGKWILAAVGWGAFFAIESYGSLVVSLFWSFTNSICTTGSSKSGYPMIIAAAQIGGIGGSACMLFAHKIDHWVLFALVTIFVVCALLSMRHFMHSIPAEQMIEAKSNSAKGAAEKKKQNALESLFAGIKLILTRPYVFGILIVSTLYEVIGQVVEYQMQTQADSSPLFSSAASFAQFQGMYGVATNLLSFLMALLGTRYLIKRFGLTFGLLFYPITLGTSFMMLFGLYTYGNPTPNQLLGATFIVMMIAKGLGYAVNNPVKEMMYIPTSKDTKFKAKGFIDVFGGRMSKLGGAQINNAFKHNMHHLMVYGTMFSLGITGVWVLAALYVGYKNKLLIKNNKIVE